MKTTIIRWHKVAEGDLPKRSGRYLIVHANSMYFSAVDYSAKYKAFNVCDFFAKEESEKFKVKVLWWAELPQLEE